MRKEIVFFNAEYYRKYSHNKFTTMGKNLYLLSSGSCPKGKSFVHNLTDVINSKATLKEKGQYIYLVSLRNYLDIVLYGDYTLNHGLVPEVPIEVIHHNRLLNYENGKIQFYFEEN